MVILAGYIIRRRVKEPPAFVAQAATAAKRKLPLIDLLRTHPWGTRRCILMTFTNVIGSATLVFGISYGTAKGYGIGFTTSDMLWVTLTANIVAVMTIPLFGALSDRIGRRSLMIFGGLAGGLLAGVYLYTIEQKNLVLVIGMVIMVQGLLFQMWNATFATFFQEQFPMRMRVTGFAVSQNVGLAIASLFPTLFTAIAPPGSTNVPLVIGSVTFGIAVVAAARRTSPRRPRARRWRISDSGIRSLSTRPTRPPTREEVVAAGRPPPTWTGAGRRRLRR